MKLKSVLLSALVLVSVGFAKAQEFGLSFSYFLPRNGEFSTPISPFSIRGLGKDLNKYLAIETGASLYRMSGLNIINVPFKSRKPLTGSGFTIFVPVELVLQFKSKKAGLDIKGGGFAFYSFAQKLNYGNIDRAIRSLEGWDVANASFDFKNKPGYGYHAGIEFSVDVTRSWGLSLEVNYLMGMANIPLKGSYSGIGPNSNGILETKPVDIPKAKVDFTGFEFSIGINLSGR
jgi:hypothetical protein